ncbi:hypothetical protein CYY_000430 [Polysphondylium violaceum]|uniref:Carbohydrate binding domain-containing protein n=1 Tax=Polysphondylium violaceum TaxID=133409 RepID=A0A8J4V2E6_9MYCE|nr:hypothetical protein CYY_000430 [Polysphondylium violaceum]
MKFTLIFAALCLCVAFASAETNNHNMCNNNSVGITAQIVASWQENGQQFSNINVEIHNYSQRRINNVVISAGYLELKDYNSIWNIQRNGNELALPRDRIIEVGGVHTFGATIRGNHIPAMWVRSVSCL